jgi:2-acylglycerol O-acyltransferase 2
MTAESNETLNEKEQKPRQRRLSALDQLSKVKWAPIRGIPLKRRLQTFAIVIWIALLPICLMLFLYLFTMPILWPLLIMYTIWLFFDKASENGGRRIPIMRRLKIWKYFAGYFPVSLIKVRKGTIAIFLGLDGRSLYLDAMLHTPEKGGRMGAANFKCTNASLYLQEGDLDPKGNYILSYHPHGIISMAAFANFATEATGFSQQYPGIVPSLLTLASNFRLPLYRDFMMSLGMCSVSKHSCEKILRSGPGRSIVIVTGGASESLSARPGTNDLTLKKRFGFIKLAIRNNASLVPVFAFGENDIYEQYDNKKGSYIWRYQKWFQSITGFTVPLAHARGIFNCKC